MKTAFVKDEYVNYSTAGICLVEDIRQLQFPPLKHPATYYILKPVRNPSSTLFVPVDNTVLLGRMKPILSQAEVDRIIQSIREEELPWIADKKLRAAEFHDILIRRDERELLLLVSCLYRRGKELDRGLPGTDQQVLKEAEAAIEEEFAFSLQMEGKEVGRYIREKLGIPEPEPAEGNTPS